MGEEEEQVVEDEVVVEEAAPAQPRAQLGHRQRLQRARALLRRVGAREHRLERALRQLLGQAHLAQLCREGVSAHSAVACVSTSSTPHPY